MRKMFNVDGKAKAGQSPWNKALFKVVDQKVRGGMINGWPTKQIADLMATDVMAAGVTGSACRVKQVAEGFVRRQWRLPGR